MNRVDLINLLTAACGESRKDCARVLSFVPVLQGFERSVLRDEAGRVFWDKVLEEVNKVTLADASRVFRALGEACPRHRALLCSIADAYCDQDPADLIILDDLLECFEISSGGTSNAKSKRSTLLNEQALVDELRRLFPRSSAFLAVIGPAGFSVANLSSSVPASQTYAEFVEALRGLNPETVACVLEALSARCPGSQTLDRWAKLYRSRASSSPSK